MKTLFVNEGQYTGKYAAQRMVDNSMKAVAMANICVETPYYTGQVKYMVMPDVL